MYRDLRKGYRGGPLGRFFVRSHGGGRTHRNPVQLRADYKLIAKALGRIGSAFSKKGDLETAIKYFQKSLTEHRTADILNKLRMKHANGGKYYGVDVDGPEGVRDNMAAFVWEPSLVKVNAISSATEAACLILSVDETVRNPQSEAVSPDNGTLTSY